MSDVIISVENISKRYRIGRQQSRHDSLADTITAGLRASTAWWRRNGRSQTMRPEEDMIWALKDVSFEVKYGEVVGIIGRNGAGKSTLLKILSQITEPTSGRVVIDGRVGSLLEVGTGFHDELTGRENIFLNGAILGMRKSEIERKFDEIVAFSGVEKFLDTPVKHYSSGMKVRLAFSVAAHLEPEILIVDEVLAVGDAEFQKKCLGKMQGVANSGRTVLFVSHNLGMVQNLCQRGILLKNGQLFLDSSINNIVNKYLEMLTGTASQDLTKRTDRRGPREIKLIGIDIFDDTGCLTDNLVTGRFASFVFHLNTLLPGTSCVLAFYDELGQLISNFESTVRSPQDCYDHTLGPKFICQFDEMLLAPGRYRVNFEIRLYGELQDHIEAATFFDVGEGVLRGRVVKTHHKIRVRIPHKWILPTS